jgi:intracellular septation protein A
MIKKSVLSVRYGLYIGSFHSYSVLIIRIMGINYLFTRYVNVNIYDTFPVCGIMATETVFMELQHVHLVSCVPYCQLLA